MKTRSRKAVSTTLAAIIIVILLIALVAAVYEATVAHSTQTVTQTGQTVTSTVSTSGTPSSSTTSASSASTATSTTTATNVSSIPTSSSTVSTSSGVSTSGGATSTGAIPAGTIIEGIVGPEWGSSNVGDDVQCGWGDQSMWYNNNYEQLFQYDPADMAKGVYVPIPWLASNYSLSSDGLSLVVNLHQGVTFHSGNTMTSADVIYSVNRFVFDKNLSSNFQNCAGSGLIYRDSFASIKSVSATGQYQVTFHLNYPDPNILNELANQGMSILDSKLLQQHTVVSGTGSNTTSDYGFAWLDAGTAGDAGTGPFMLTSFTYEQRAELQSYPKYWGGAFGNYSSNVKTIIMIPYADATTAQFALVQGQINMVQDETTNAIKSLSSQTDISINTSPAFEAFNLYMHPVGPLSDWRVRDAVKDAINYTALTQSLTNGYAKPDDSFFYIGMQGFNGTTANYYANQGPNDTGAKALLKAAGYPNGFSVNLYTRPSSRYGITFVDMAEILQSDLAAVGITLNIQVYVVGQFYTLAGNTTLPGIWTVPGSLILLSPLSNIEEVLGNGNTQFIGWNATTEKGPSVPFSQMYNLYNESQRATNQSSAIADEQQLDKLYLKYGPTVQMFQVSNTVAYSNSIKGVVWSSLSDGFIPTYLSIT